MGERQKEKSILRWWLRTTLYGWGFAVGGTFLFFGVVLIALPWVEGFSAKGTLISSLSGVGCLLVGFVILRALGPPGKLDDEIIDPDMRQRGEWLRDVRKGKKR